MKRNKTSAAKGALLPVNVNHRYNTRFKLRHNAPTPSTQVSKLPVNSKYRRGVVPSIFGQKGVVPCRRTWEMKRHAPYLPNDIMFSILILLPAKLLYNVMRCVCSQWRSIIKDPLFAIAHFQLAPTGILLHDPWNGSRTVFSAKGKGVGMEVLKFQLPFGVCGSCNGLILLHEWSNPIFHVGNLVTNVVVSLPPFHCSIMSGHARDSFHWERRQQCEATLAYSSIHGRYKVVHVSIKGFDIQVMVCTVADDGAWRPIDFEPCSKTESSLLHRRAHFVGGYIYWLHIGFAFGLALDVDDEKVYRFPTPMGYRVEESLCSIVNMGKRIGMVQYMISGWWKFWELTDPKSGKWAIVLDIDMVRLCRRLDSAYCFKDCFNECFTTKPVLYLEETGDLWIHISKAMGDPYAYEVSLAGIARKGTLALFNVKTGKLCRFEIGGYFLPYPHTESLLSP